MTLSDVLAAALRPGPMVAYDSPAAWWRDHLVRTASCELPIDRAIVGATRVDCLGFAFAGGYASALSSMVPALPRETLASFAATEEGGAHPRAITTTLRKRPDGGFELEGSKKWVTLGPEGGVVLVVARLEEPHADHPRLRVARVDVKTPGVTITPLESTTFVPEIPHASIRFDAVRLPSEAILPGDGYDTYLKPFRTIEDIYVHAALWAWLLAIGSRSGFPPDYLASGAALLGALRALASEPPSSPHVHVALAGLISTTRVAVAALESSWANIDAPELRARWERDRALLSVASAARAARFEKAWSLVGAQRNAYPK